MLPQQKPYALCKKFARRYVPDARSTFFPHGSVLLLTETRIPPRIRRNSRNIVSFAHKKNFGTLPRIPYNWDTLSRERPDATRNFCGPDTRAAGTAALEVGEFLEVGAIPESFPGAITTFSRRDFRVAIFATVARERACENPRARC